MNEKFVSLDNAFAANPQDDREWSKNNEFGRNRFTTQELPKVVEIAKTIATEVFEISFTGPDWKKQINIYQTFPHKEKNYYEDILNEKEELEKLIQCKTTQQAIKAILEIAGNKVKNIIKKIENENLLQYIEERINDLDNPQIHARKKDIFIQKSHQILKTIFWEEIDLTAPITTKCLNTKVPQERGPNGEITINLKDFEKEWDLGVFLECLQKNYSKENLLEKITLPSGQIDDFIKYYLHEVAENSFRKE
jgi:hypothetical protein